MEIQQINLNDYLDLYPDRYIRDSKIDFLIYDIILNSNKKLVSLDIGGNKEGTKALRETIAYFLDPFINKPDFYVEQLTWENVKNYKFDLIIAKNSLNYLDENQLQIIPTFLNKNGIFLANTFLKPIEISREFFNSRSKKRGNERTEYKNGKIYHYLEIDNIIIEHSFYYYSFYKLIEIFENENLNFEITSPNSMIIKIKKE